MTLRRRYYVTAARGHKVAALHAAKIKSPFFTDWPRFTESVPHKKYTPTVCDVISGH